jgi:hypothetical protein
MGFLVEKSLQNNFTLRLAVQFPANLFKDWLLAQMLRNHKNRGNSDVDFNSDPLFVMFNVADAQSLLNSPPSTATHVGFFFGNEGKGASLKHRNITCYMCLTQRMSDDSFNIVHSGGKQVYEGGPNGSASVNQNQYRDRIQQYLNRVGDLRKQTNPRRADFGQDERSGIHYPINEFQGFISYITNLPALRPKSKFKSYFVKRTDRYNTTALVHSVEDFNEEVDIYKLTIDNDLFDQGSGCCPIP